MTDRQHGGQSPRQAVSSRFQTFVAVLLSVLAAMLSASPVAIAAATQIDDYRWTGVERTIAIGDLHGDFENYLLTLKAAGLIDGRKRWSGGKTHLVQLGDIPDRGADTLKIIAHMNKLGKQAKKSGGRVHNLMGNHEAMNTYGDLRYVSDGEFAAFAGRDSGKLRDRYFDNVLAAIQSRDAAEFASLPEDFRDKWNKSHPLGWVEHQQAWNPKWNTEAEYFQWVMDLKVAVQINGLVFLHGGISSRYCRNSLASLTEQARIALRAGDSDATNILTDEWGPLWYRGLSGVEPEASVETVEAILADKSAQHIVVGHTRTEGAIWPSYSARVIQIDTGISSAYGGPIGYLEVDNGRLFAGYRDGRVELPDSDSGRLKYLSEVAALLPENASLQKQLVELQHAAAGADADSAPTSTSAARPASAKAGAAAAICGISP